MEVSREQPPARPVEEPPAPGSPSPSGPQTPRERVVDFARRRRRWLIGLGVLVVLYTVFGFFILPIIVKRQLERRASEALQRQVTVQRVRTNPWALSVTIDGLEVKERDGGPFISWERLYVNMTLWRLITRTLDLEEVQLVRFRARIALDQKGDLNFQDILDRQSSEPKEPEKKSSLVFAIDSLDIVQAEIDFSDRSRRKPFDSQIGPFGIRLTNFRSVPTSTAPYSFTGSTESGETFSWAGSVLTEPVRSTGTITFEGLELKKYSPYYEDSVGFEIRDGKLGVKTSYQLEWGGEKRVLKILDGAVAVRSLILGLPGAPTPKAEFPAIDIGGIGVDVPGRVARVETVAIKEATIRAHRNKDGQLDLEAMGPPKSEAPSKPTPKEDQWQWSLGKIDLARWRVELQDEVPKRPVSLVLAPFDFQLQDVASTKGQTSQLSLSTVWNGAGKIEVAGPVQLLRPSGNLAVKIEALDLRPLDPYLDTYADLAARLGDGRFRINGKARFDASVKPATWAFAGDTGIDKLILLDSDRNQEVARWRDLQVSGIDAVSEPMAVKIRAIRWLEPKVRVAISEDGSSNLKRLLKTPPDKEKKKGGEKEEAPTGAQAGTAESTTAGAAPPATGTGTQPVAPATNAQPVAATTQPSAAKSNLTPTPAGPQGLAGTTVTPVPASSGQAAAAKGGPPAATEQAAATEAAPKKTGKSKAYAEPPVAASIGNFQIVRGAAALADRSVAPPVAMSLTDLDVRIRGLSNARNARSQVAIKALVSGGPLEVSGVLSPRMINAATDVKVSSKGVDLTPLSPYCGKYAGYILDKGTLDLDLDYKVARRHLASTNVIKINQFTFGEATNSPDATKLPVKLGLAILQDRDGLIELDVPVEGNVDDPNFRLGKVIWHAIGNVLIKAVTAPFALLGKLVGGGGGPNDKIDVVDFQAGTATLTPSAEKTLQGLTKALNSRPQLRMDIEGTADPTADARNLRLQELKRQAQLAVGGGKGKEITDEAYEKYLEAQYKKIQPGGAPAPTAGATSDPKAMEDAVLASIQLPPEAMRALAQERGSTVKARLIALGVDAGRLFPAQGGERAKKEGGARAYFTLK